MYQKNIGLQLKNDSISYVIVETEDKKEFNVITQGVRVFEPGVKLEKGKDISLASERTEHRRARIYNARRRKRKINVIRTLLDYKLCPPVPEDELKNWRNSKLYPSDSAFNKWLSVSKGTNPYEDRMLAVTKKFDLNDEDERYRLGRALYHINQRRGYMSNRLATTEESDGVVKQSIDFITEQKGELTLGQYYYNRFVAGEKIRGDYTGRLEHYQEEFDKICEMQELPREMKDALHHAIFFQLPLKSQKHLIGKCPFEKNKNKAYKSHPLAEEFVMLQFLNNIKIKRPEDQNLRSLTKEEKESLKGRFYLKRDSFPFKDLAKQLAPAKKCVYIKSKDILPDSTCFNYPLDTTVVSCHTSARLMDWFGPTWDTMKLENTEGEKTIDAQDIWNVLKSFDSNEKLRAFAESIGLSDEEQDKFMNTHLKEGYLKYSLKAIKKILPYLREGYHLKHAILFANIRNIFGDDVYRSNKKDIDSRIKKIIDYSRIYGPLVNTVNGYIKKCKDENWTYSTESYTLHEKDLTDLIYQQFGENENIVKIVDFGLNSFATSMKKNNGSGEFLKQLPLKKLIYNDLSLDYAITEKDIERLYDPAEEDEFKPKVYGADDLIYLNMPFNDSYKNPALLRMMFQLKTLLNLLIAEGSINQYTNVDIVFDSDLLSANERRAHRGWEKDQAALREKAEKAISEYVSDVTSEMVDNYLLWEEQGQKCAVTGKQIKLGDLLNDKGTHTRHYIVPTHLLPDESNTNMMLCDKEFVRKRNSAFLVDTEEFEEIKENYKYLEEKITALKKVQFGYRKKATLATAKELKDTNISMYVKIGLDIHYYEQKLYNLKAREKFLRPINRQFSEIGMTSKAISKFLKTLFNRVYIKKKSDIGPFKAMWGMRKVKLPGYMNNVANAFIVAVSNSYYDELSRFYYHLDLGEKYKAKKPFDKLNQYLLNLYKNTNVVYHSVDKLTRKAKRAQRINGKLVRDNRGNIVYSKGDCARMSLHKDTFYGATEVVQDGKTFVRCTISKAVSDLGDGDIKKIADEPLRQIIEKGREAEKCFVKDIDELKQKLKKCEEDEVSIIKDQIKVLQNSIEGLYVYPSGDIIKKVKVWAHITNPMTLKPHRDQSKHEHKRNYLVAKDGNQMMCIYEGLNKMGEIERAATVIDNLSAARYFKESNIKKRKKEDIDKLKGLIPDNLIIKDTQLFHARTVIKNMMVLMYRETPEEIKWDDKELLSNRLYYVRGINMEELILMHHLENRTVGEVKDMMNANINQDNLNKGILDKKKTMAFLKKSGIVLKSHKDLSLIAKRVEDSYRIEKSDGNVLIEVDDIKSLIKTSSIGVKGGDVVDKQDLFPYVKMTLSNLNLLYEGADFKIDKLGNITKI